MNYKLASITMYLIIAGYFFASLYTLVFVGNGSSNDWLSVLNDAWLAPEYAEIFKIAIASICINLFVALLLFKFTGRTKIINYYLVAMVWGLALTAWFVTPGLLIAYILGAFLTTVSSAQNLNHIRTKN